MQSNALTAVKWLFLLCARHRWQLWSAVILACAASLCALVPVYFVYLIVDSIVDANLALQPVWQWVLVAVFMMLARYLCLFFSAALSHRCAYHIQHRIRELAIHHLGKVSLGFFTYRSSGEIKKIVAEDVERIEIFVAHQIPDLVAAIVTPLFSFGLLLFVDYRMALVALVPIPLAILSQAFLYRDFAAKTELYHTTLGELNSCVTEFARAMPVVRMFNAGEKQHQKLDSSINAYRILMARWTSEAAWPFAAFKVLLDSGLVVLVPVGLYLWADGSLSVGGFILSILLGVGMMEPLFNLSMLSAYLNQIFGGVARLQELLGTEVKAYSEQPLPLEDYSVRFEQVQFSYPEADESALQAINFTAKSGSLTAIVGPSGAGKSTLAMLIARFWAPQQGNIFIGGQPLDQLNESQLMESISFVFQDTFLFNKSVRDNLTMGNVYSDKQIEHAAKAAFAYDFICQLPRGYDTILGKDTRLSGGERQRIAIARAILKDAPVLLLDEPTANADASSQAYIHRALNNLTQGKTVFVVAHRLSTIVGADQILVMDQGQIVEQGTHQQLLDQNGTYQRMWRAHQSAQNWVIPHQEQPKQEAQYA